jgi:heat shock protein HslJ
MKRVLSIAFVLLLFVTLTVGCNDKDKDNTSQKAEDNDKAVDIAGTWEIHEADFQNKKISMALFTELTGIKIEMSFEFMENGKATVAAEGNAFDGTWKKNGNDVDVEFNGATTTLVKKDDKLELPVPELGDSCMIIFKKT